MDIRRRMLFKKKASSSGGGGSTTGGSYTVNLNSQWEKTTAVTNPDSTLYDGVYRSSSNYNVNSGVAIMYITIKDCSSFKMYIRSYAESCCDYVMVSQLDQTINGNTSYSSTTLVKAHTKNNQQSGTALSSYTLVEFTGITSGEHTITVVYRKDGSVNNGDDRGYVLIEKIQADSGDSGGDDVIPEPIINIDNYLTIEALEDGLTASLSTNACEYCVDGNGNWKTLAAGTATESINSGHTLSFRGNLTPVKNVGIGTFTISKKCNLSGKCASMLYGDGAANNYSISSKAYAFYMLFTNNNTIVDASQLELPTNTSDYCYNAMFYQCRKLVGAPTLGTSTSLGCYNSMFRECDQLVVPPALPATTAASGCYKRMFQDCPSLLEAPELPARGINEQCYQYMFYGCSSLTTAPELPATTLARNCYQYMFYNCTNLTAAPELPATTIADYCYEMMFDGCTRLTTAPELPATTLASSCYRYMFSGCTNLTTAPELPATKLVSYCYERMFEDCNKLNYIKMLATDISARNCLSNWVSGVSSTGTFVKNHAMTSLPTSTSGIPSGWTVVNDGEPIINIDNYLTIEALENGLTASLSTNACEYCVDGDGNWKSLAAGASTESINTGHTLSFRGELTPITAGAKQGIGKFTISKKCNLKGNCMSMLFGDNAVNNYSLSDKRSAFFDLFYNCSNIVTVSSGFLPATTIAHNCYYRMFWNCKSLTTAPELPATALADNCYEYMFYGCSKLNYIKMLATDISASDCLSYWANAVATTGTFVKHPNMTTLPTGSSGIPSGWTVVNDGEESGGGGSSLTFPIYLTSVEGKGKERTIEPNADIFSFIEYADKVSSFDTNGGYWYLPLSNNDIIFVIDGIPFYVNEGYDNNGQWYLYQLYDHSSNTISGWWSGSIERSGHMHIWDDE